jgi:predicted ATPase
MVKIFVGMNGCGKTAELQRIAEKARCEGKRVSFLSRPDSTTEECLEVISVSDVVCIDNIEDRLHPVLQLEFARNIIAKAKKHNTSLYCTTHSPYILDPFDYENVFCFISGSNDVKALIEHKDAKTFKGALTPGEFWSSIPVDWKYDE